MNATGGTFKAAFCRAAIGAGAIGLLAGVGIGPATAQELDGAVTAGAPVTSADGSQNSTSFGFTWALSPGTRPGDTLGFAFPAGWQGELPDLASPEGTVFARGSRNGDTATYTLTDAVLQYRNLHGEVSISAADRLSEPIPGVTTTRTSTASGTVARGELPGGFFGTADRQQANKWGVWLGGPGAESIGWTVESPAGPWDHLTFVDKAAEGQSLDCSAPITLQSTSTTDPATGYLTNLTPVQAGRYTVACDSTQIEVRVKAVAAGELLELKFEADVTDQGRNAFTNTADVVGERTEGGSGPVVVDGSRTWGPVSQRTWAETDPVAPPAAVAPPAVVVPPAAEVPPSTPPVSVTQITRVDTPVARPGSELAYTGVDAQPWAAASVVLLATGAAMVFAMRRRRLAE